MNILTKAIRKTTGLSMRRFVEEHLGIKYQTFLYRKKNGVLRLEDYHLLCYHTGMTFEQLFPSPYQVPRRLQKIILTPPNRPPVNKVDLIRDLQKEARSHTLKKKSQSEPVLLEDFLEPSLQKSEARRGVEKNNPDDDFPFEDVYEGVDLGE